MPTVPAPLTSHHPATALACPSCGGHGPVTFYDGGTGPVHNVLLMDSRDEARHHPRGRLSLAHCRRCGFITNTAFDPSLMRYSPRCEDTQHHSPHFLAFAERLVRRLVNDYGLRRRTVLDIGCGKGDFLDLVCRAGHNRGIGVDPACDPEGPKESRRRHIHFIPEYYSDQHKELAFDAVLCRHTLEHVPATRELLTTLRDSIGDRLDTLLFFELPDTTRVLREAAFWDVYYEHCSYFTAGSLARLFRETGFEVVELWRDYGDQYLLLTAVPAAAPTLPRLALEDDLKTTADDVETFSHNVPEIVTQWQRRMAQLSAEGKKPVLWGGSSKAVGFVATLGLTDEVEYIVDVNPQKCGKFLPGSGHEIVAPEFLRDYHPEAVIVMNPVYCDEIRTQLAALGLAAELLPA